ncbi:MAG: hypothetical protein ACRELB_00580 [Polyangiaceae bacterium]
MRLFARAPWAGLLGIAMATAAVGCGGGSGGSGNGSGPDDAGGAADQQLPHPEAGVVLDGGGVDATAESSIDDGSTGDVTEAAPVEAAAFATAAHSPWPVLTPNAGIVLHDMKLVIVASSGDPQASDYFAYGDALIASAWWQSFATEYGLGTPTTSTHVTGPAITTDPTSQAMVKYITSAVAASPDAGAGANGDTMYMLFLPTGVDIQDQRGPNTSCQYYGGYHTTYDNSGDAWGVVQHCPITNTGLTDLQWMTIGASHEIAEAATDPIPDNGYTLVPQIDYAQPWTQPPWAASLYGEVGDMCVETQITEGSYMYQRIWSIAAAAKGLDPCVPPHAQYAYVNTSAPKGWYTVAAGTSVNVPITGWSDRATPDWIVAADIWSQSGTGYTATISSPTTKNGYATTNNGKASTLTITAPVSASPGSWAIAYIASETFVSTGDQYHLWVVGAYVQ